MDQNRGRPASVSMELPPSEWYRLITEPNGWQTPEPKGDLGESRPKPVTNGN